MVSGCEAVPTVITPLPAPVAAKVAVGLFIVAAVQLVVVPTNLQLDGLTLFSACPGSGVFTSAVFLASIRTLVHCTSKRVLLLSENLVSSNDGLTAV